MRETRYAVMALAEAFPRPRRAAHGWANRDDGPARLPRTDSLVHTLDDLENLWDVPEPDRARFARAIDPLLDHRRADGPGVGRGLPGPAGTGRVGRGPRRPARRSVQDRLARGRLGACGDWATRGWAWTRSPRHSRDPNPRTRRGAARIFAYQFQGMDTRLDVAESLIGLTRDPDLWTRLQALRTLRQWFYRTNDTALARRIVDTYLARMAEPDVAVIRKNLSEGLYIMLDENLGGGVSLQKNIESLPEAMRPRIMDARRAFERDVLIDARPGRARTGKRPPARRRCSTRSTDRFSRAARSLASPRP